MIFFLSILSDIVPPVNDPNAVVIGNIAIINPI